MIHDNSLAAFHSEEPKLSAREQMVFDWISLHGPHTDREVMEGLGFKEPNAVRPRITALIERNKLMEVCNRKCPVTGKTVRVVDVRKSRSLFDGLPDSGMPRARLQSGAWCQEME